MTVHDIHLHVWFVLPSKEEEQGSQLKEDLFQMQVFARWKGGRRFVVVSMVVVRSVQ